MQTIAQIIDLVARDAAQRETGYADDDVAAVWDDAVRSARPPSASSGENLLVGLAWLGLVTTTQIRRLWFPTQSGKHMPSLLRQMEREGVISGTPWAVHVPHRVTPARQAIVWRLTERGRESVAEEETYPSVYLAPRSRRMFPHDTMTTEVLVRLVELTRPQGLRGFFVERECRVDQRRARPIMDAFVSLRLSGGASYPDLVPWTQHPLAPGETRYRFAVENDRNTEESSIIRAKALSYQEALSARWKEKYGGPPTPLWVVPTAVRGQLVQRAWSEVWPDGTWLLTTDADLNADQWLLYQAGTLESGAFTDLLPYLMPA